MDGFRQLMADRWMRRLTLAWALIMVGVGPVIVAEVVLAHHFRVGSVGYGLISVFWDGGGVAGAILGARLRRRFEQAAVVGGSAAIATGFAIVGLTPIFWPVLLGMLIAGVFDSFGTVAAQNVLQRRTPDRIRSRVSAALDAIVLGAMGLSFALGAPLVTWLGAQGVYVAASVITVAATAHAPAGAPAHARAGRDLAQALPPGGDGPDAAGAAPRADAPARSAAPRLPRRPRRPRDRVEPARQISREERRVALRLPHRDDLVADGGKPSGAREGGGSRARSGSRRTSGRRASRRSTPRGRRRRATPGRSHPGEASAAPTRTAARGRRGHVRDRVERADAVERRRLEVDVAEVAQDELGGGNVPARPRDLLGRDVDAHDGERLRQPARRRQAGAAAEVEHAPAGPDEARELRDEAFARIALDPRAPSGEPVGDAVVPGPHDGGRIVRRLRG